MPRRPHIVIFNPDQWRGDVMGHMGNAAAVTPNLDRLAAEDAVSFRHAYCQNPVCTPSRCSFMTGWYPHVRGHRSLLHMLRPDDPCLLKLLKDSGYHVWWAGKNDLVPAQHGFDAYCDVRFRDTPEDHQRWGYTRRRYPWIDPEFRGKPGNDNFYSFLATATGRLDKRGEDIYLTGDWCNVLAAQELIARWPRDGGERPLCLYMPLNYPHVPYGVEEPYYSRIDPAKLPPRIAAPASGDWYGKPAMLREIHRRLNMEGWTEDRWDTLRKTYYGMCACVDDQFGRIVAALKQAGIYDDTAIFFFSDHGDFTGDYGLVEKNQNTFEDCLTRVPLLIKPPRGTDCVPGIRDALTELIDVPATIYAMTGIEPGYTHFGRSLLDIMADPGQAHREAVFCEGGRLIGEKHCRDYHRDEEMSPQHPYWPREYAQDQELPQIAKATMCRTREFKYVRRLMEPDELYDLRQDPRELNNVAEEAAYGDVLRQMKDRMLRFYQETIDVVPHDYDLRWVTHGIEA
jgi:arylsulfatase A-like enzyme